MPYYVQLRSRRCDGSIVTKSIAQSSLRRSFVLLCVVIILKASIKDLSAFLEIQSIFGLCYLARKMYLKTEALDDITYTF